MNRTYTKKTQPSLTPFIRRVRAAWAVLTDRSEASTWFDKDLFVIESKWPDGVTVCTALRDDGTAEDVATYPSIPGLGRCIQIVTRPQTFFEKRLASQCPSKNPADPEGKK